MKNYINYKNWQLNCLSKIHDWNGLVVSSGKINRTWWIDMVTNNLRNMDHNIILEATYNVVTINDKRNSSKQTSKLKQKKLE